MTQTMRRKFGDFIESTKDIRGAADNYTYKELRRLAVEFLNK